MWRWRTALCMTAVLTLAVLMWLVRWRVERGAGWSPLFLVTASGLALQAMLCLVAAALPRHRLESFRNFSVQSLSRLRETRANGIVPLPIWCVVLLLSVLSLASVFATPFDSAVNDQGAYLQLSREVRQHGGIPAFATGLIRGSGAQGAWYREANRHPLYPALLAVGGADVERPAHILWGRLVSAASIVCMVGLIVWWLRRHEGGVAACVFLGLCACNRSLHETAGFVTCEGVLSLAITAGWLTVTSSAEENSRWKSLLPVVAGVSFGLAWLAKQTGLLFLAGLPVWWLWQRAIPGRDVIRAHPRPWLVASLFLAGWFLMASPLLVRNVREFGNPFYNVNSWLMFVDTFEDPARLAGERTLGEQRRLYLETHSPRQIVTRVLSGFLWEGLIVGRSLGPLPWQDGRLLPGALLLAMVILGCLARQDGPGRMLAVWAAVQLPLYAWYVPVAAGDRFVAPLVAPALAYAAIGLTRVWLASYAFGSTTAAPAQS